MIGTSFPSGAGKCTAGIIFVLIKNVSDLPSFLDQIFDKDKLHSVSSSQKDYSGYSDHEKESQNSMNQKNQALLKKPDNFLMILDSQEMLSSEVNKSKYLDPDFDRKMAVFLISVCQILLLNFEGEINEGFLNLLEISFFTFLKLDLEKNDLFTFDDDSMDLKIESKNFT